MGLIKIRGLCLRRVYLTAALTLHGDGAYVSLGMSSVESRWNSVLVVNARLRLLYVGAILQFFVLLTLVALTIFQQVPFFWVSEQWTYAFILSLPGWIGWLLYALGSQTFSLSVMVALLAFSALELVADVASFALIMLSLDGIYDGTLTLSVTMGTQIGYYAATLIVATQIISDVVILLAIGTIINVVSNISTKSVEAYFTASVREARIILIGFGVYIDALLATLMITCVALTNEMPMWSPVALPNYAVAFSAMHWVSWFIFLLAESLYEQIMHYVALIYAVLMATLDLFNVVNVLLWLYYYYFNSAGMVPGLDTDGSQLGHFFALVVLLVQFFVSIAAVYALVILSTVEQNDDERLSYGGIAMYSGRRKTKAT